MCLFFCQKVRDFFFGMIKSKIVKRFTDAKIGIQALFVVSGRRVGTGNNSLQEEEIRFFLRTKKYYVFGLFTVYCGILLSECCEVFNKSESLQTRGFSDKRGEFLEQ